MDMRVKARDAGGRRDVERGSTTDGLPVAPSLATGLAVADTSRQPAAIGNRVVALAGVCAVLGVLAALVAQALSRLINLVTNLAFFATASLEAASPANNRLGAWVVGIPVAGAVIVGLMARYGSKAIRGHGIPEAMEQVLFNQSRIPARLTFLKPLSAVVAIGTGGPFGAEGPIIATGGALGSLVGQLLRVSAEERKTLLAAGAAGGMAATFGTPIAAVLLAIELLLFEYRSRSIVPVAIASAVATSVRVALVGSAPAFLIPDIAPGPPAAMLGYVAIGGAVGLAAVGVTKCVYGIEDLFGRLRLHWMWWPAVGAVGVGIIGVVAPRTMGVGYDNIEQMMSGTLLGRVAIVLCVWKFVSWSIALGSGTSGGTLAPLFTIGGGLGAIAATTLDAVVPALGVDPRTGALIGMAAMFGGASRAMLTSVVFAFETTRQPMVLLPLLAACAAAHLVSCRLMKHSIMTEKIARRGMRVPSEYVADYLGRLPVAGNASAPVVSLRASQTLGSARRWLGSSSPGSGHQGFPVLDDGGALQGVVTRRDLLGSDVAEEVGIGSLIRRPPVVVTREASLRDVADTMVRQGVGRVVVVDEGDVVGIVTRSDLLEAHGPRLADEAVG